MPAMRSPSTEASPDPAALVVPGHQAGEEPHSALAGQGGRCQELKIFCFLCVKLQPQDLLENCFKRKKN